MIEVTFQAEVGRVESMGDITGIVITDFPDQIYPTDYGDSLFVPHQFVKLIKAAPDTLEDALDLIDQLKEKNRCLNLRVDKLESDLRQGKPHE